MNATIQITFSSPADPSTVNAVNILLNNGPWPNSPDGWPGIVSYDANSNTATLTPYQGMPANHLFTVIVGGVTSSTGAPMTGEFTSTFTTTPKGTPSSICPGEVITDPGFGGPYSVSPFVCTQYLAPMYQGNAQSVQDTPIGNIAMDGSGNIAVGLSSVAPSTNFTVQFCPAYNAGSSASAPACFAVGAVSSDASGSRDIGGTTFKFPQSGSWAGEFQITSGSSLVGQTGWPVTTILAHQIFMIFMLEPETTVNGTGIATGTQDPMSGPESLSSFGDDMSGQLNGAEPSATYTFSESLTRSLNGYQLSPPFTTDSNGNAQYGAITQNGGDLFQIVPQDSSHAGWIGGFSVPQ